tara:strand:+ start:14013 stop:14363 length:351 start_codon:yes stop_codon:yes gene_type:complete
MKFKNELTENVYGYDIVIAEGKDYASKLYYINPGAIIGLRINQFKEHTIYVVAGSVRAWKNTNINDWTDIAAGESYHVVPGSYYRYQASPDQTSAAVVIEISSNCKNDLNIVENNY